MSPPPRTWVRSAQRLRERTAALRTFLRRLPVATKITATLAAILTLMALAAVPAIFQMFGLSSRMEYMSRTSLPLVRASYQLEIVTGELAATAVLFLSTEEPRLVAQSAVKRAELDSLLAFLRTYAPRTSTGDGIVSIARLVEEIDSAIGDLIDTLPQSAIREARARGEIDFAQESIASIARNRLVLNELLDQSLRGPTELDVAETFVWATKTSRTQVALTVTMIALALLLSGIAAEKLADEISDPLRVLVRAAAYVSAGRHSGPLALDSSREFNTLALAFDRMAERLDASMRALQASAERADAANAAKSALVSEVSHDLKTPLTSLRGSLVLLTAGGVDPASDAGTQMLKVALSSTERLSRLISDRLDLDRIDAGQLQLTRHVIQPVLLVREAITSVAAIAQGKGVRFNVTGDSPPLYGDHDRLLQVLVNLIGNAVSFSPAGGEVRVRLHEGNGFTRIEVEDEGEGVPESQRPHLFKPFTQAHKRRPGSTGLGLAIARGIVEQHGGEIGLATDSGRGACFWFTVPVAADSPT